LWNSDATLEQVTVSAGQGGDGGDGGAGQAGGLGGLGASCTWNAILQTCIMPGTSGQGNPYGGTAQGEGSNGGRGGDGGDGGPGGAGGGGAGGSSIGLLLGGGSMPSFNAVSIVTNPAGAGGSPNGPNGLRIGVHEVP
jgi:hypothetical protein